MDGKITLREGGKSGEKEKTGVYEESVADAAEIACGQRQLPGRQNQFKDRAEDYRSKNVRKGEVCQSLKSGKIG